MLSLRLTSIAAIALCLAASPAAAMPNALEPESSAADFAAFAPRPSLDVKLDFSIWTAALRHAVLSMGPSLRHGSSTPERLIGTRLYRGHDSLYRMEANRVAFSMLDDDVLDSFRLYREDLEQLGGTIDIAALPRNEQLAYWLNLHNVAIMDQIARNYPIVQPSRIEIDGVPMDEARFITVGGVALSPRDIRTRIVYPNWRDPRVIYGFWRGDIGGPTIQREAFDARNLRMLLGESAREFVNALRGTEKRGRTLHISRIYEEAAPFYFPDLDADLRDHLRAYATDKVSAYLGEVERFRTSIYEPDIADLAGGERQMLYQPVKTLRGTEYRTGVPLTVQRFMLEREVKRQTMVERGILKGRVILLPAPGEASPDAEIE